MSTGIVKAGNEVPGERIVCSLINLPRTKLDLVECSGGENNRRQPIERYFVLRKMHFLAPGNVNGFEIRLDLDAARVLSTAIRKETNGGDGASSLSTAAVISHSGASSDMPGDGVHMEEAA